jgi:hypothetical protein
MDFGNPHNLPDMDWTSAKSPFRASLNSIAVDWEMMAAASEASECAAWMNASRSALVAPGSYLPTRSGMPQTSANPIQSLKEKLLHHGPESCAGSREATRDAVDRGKALAAGGVPRDSLLFRVSLAMKRLFAKAGIKRIAQQNRLKL